MNWALVDAALRGATVSQFLLLAGFFGRDWRKSLTARLGTVLTFSAACYVTLLAVDAYVAWPWWRMPLHVMSLAAPPLFWLFASSWFDDEFRLRRWHWVPVIAAVLCGVLGAYFFRTNQMLGAALGLAWRALSIGAVALGVRASLRGRAGDLLESRRRIRLALAILVSVAIACIVLAELRLSGWPPPDSWRAANALGMFILAATISFAVLGWRDPALVVAPPKAEPLAKPRAEADDTSLLARLDAEMRRERLYRQDGLTITAVAARLGVPEYRLRRAINQGLGARNFNTYLNGFRLVETREALADPAQRDVPILTIALDAGFGSVAPFNRAFREQAGCTPSDFRARALSGIANPIG